MSSRKLSTALAAIAALGADHPALSRDTRGPQTPTPPHIQDLLIAKSDAKKARKNAKRLKERTQEALQEISDLGQEQDRRSGG